MAVDAETRAMGDSDRPCDAAHGPQDQPLQRAPPAKPDDAQDASNNAADKVDEEQEEEQHAAVEEGAAGAASDEPSTQDGTKDDAAASATGGRADASGHNRSSPRSDASQPSSDMLRVQPPPAPQLLSRSHAAAASRATPDEDEDVMPPETKNGKNFEISDLFTNAHLERKSAMVVLRKDPFCIPRATDPVTEYRPRFNPLNILVSEEKLLPRNFVIDFSEGIPGVPPLDKKRSERETAAPPRKGSFSDSNGSSSFMGRKIPTLRPPQTFGDKLSTMGMLMGSLPRQQMPPTPVAQTTTTTAPTLPNPFGEPLMELVATSDPPATSPSAPLTVSASITSDVPSSLPQLTPTGSFSPDVLSSMMDAVTVAPSTSTISTPGLSINAELTKPTVTGDLHAFNAYGYRLPPPPTPPTFGQLMNYLPDRTPAGGASEAEYHRQLLLQQQAQAQAQTQGAPPSSVGMSQFLPSHLYAPGAVAGAGAALVGPSGSVYEPLTDDYASLSTFAAAAASVASGDHPVQSDLSASTQSMQPVAKKPRSKNVFRQCTTPGCTKGARGKSGLCQKHGGGKRCSVPNCPKGAQGSSSYCLFHGGGYRCTVPGCSTGARGTSGLCAKHGGYKRARGGSDEPESGSIPAKQPRMELQAQVLMGQDG
ncbi:hypothetical protein P43SY_006123 [Pythium insidiosum]|uniref:Uncharacterized protein n=1 Tax=Pythium insidiosum TaxID=114742 RepID=A0AAD5LGI8_PYTIN|nr:hypothetical protein P43SY_006123 [Pythium insidiosum]